MSSATPSPKWPRSSAVRRRHVASWPRRPAAAFARRRLRRPPTAQQADIVRDFKQAWEAKDIDALIGLLDPDATAIGDGGGLVSAVLRPIEGGEQIARAGRRSRRQGTGNLTILERTVNGQPGLVAQQDGVTVTVIAFDIAGDRIKHIWAITHPPREAAADDHMLSPPRAAPPSFSRRRSFATAQGRANPHAQEYVLSPLPRPARPPLACGGRSPAR